jgi:L-rhamnose 1-dehydrogenase
MLLKDKVVLVINAELPAGKAIAIDCARHGAHVAINADPMTRQAAEILSATAALGRRGYCIEGGALDTSGAQALVDEVVQALGRLDVLVSCAPATPSYDVLSTPADAFQRAVTVGVTGIYAGLQAAARQMIAQGAGGAIIAVNAEPLGQALNAMAYAETQDLMQMWAETLRKDDIRCNMVRLNALEAEAGADLTKFDDLIGPVVFLASDLARNVSGATIRVGDPAPQAVVTA